MGKNQQASVQKGEKWKTIRLGEPGLHRLLSFRALANQPESRPAIHRSCNPALRPTRPPTKRAEADMQ